MKKIKSQLKQSITLALIIFIISCSKNNDPIPQTTLTACITLPSGTLSTGQSLLFTSCAKATSYVWDFGDGKTSTVTVDTVRHTYQSAGTFTVKLTVSNTSQSASTTKSVGIVQSQSTGTSGCSTHTGVITKNETWASGCHIISGSLYIDQGVTLTIMPGATVKLASGALIQTATIYNSPGASSIVANGTSTSPIIFTSNATSPAPGDWGNIVVYQSNAQASFQYCIFEYGGGQDNVGSKFPMLNAQGGGSVSIANCEFRYSANYAVEVDNSSKLTLFTNNYIHNISNYAMHLPGSTAGSIGTGNKITSKGVLVTIDPISVNVEWTGLTCPYVPEGNLYIGSSTGNTLTLDAGVKLAFQSGTSLIPYQSSSLYTLITNGTASNPVIFTALDSTAGWNSIPLGKAASSNTYFRYTNFYNPAAAGALLSTSGTLNMENCSFKGNTSTNLLLSQGAQFGVFQNNDFGASKNYSIMLYDQGNIAALVNNTYSGNKNVYVYLNGNNITSDYTWPALPVYYYLPANIYVGNATSLATLTIAPGTKFLLDGSIIVGELYSSNGPVTNVNGALVAVGTSSNPIIFQSNSATKSDIGLIMLEGTGVNTVNGSGLGSNTALQYCQVNGNGVQVGIAIYNVENSTTNTFPTISNCTITNCSQYPIYYDNVSYPNISNNTYTGNGTNAPFHN